ncbi:ExeA family protein [Sulfurirhabdus autotrophica]|uniref:Type II secretion system protein A n=1 Tax=Sulfurirhabdus autotrophica TaxID=1706046 RepID=A0A4R3Y9M3_9PROT|nr:ExeA family protein [Sulfurirhabdus autotrophica]TCV87344.1 type II secretion system protein A [Sulfurirhabdus autotrophica]
MYKSYFGFTEAPFSIAPDPRYLYMSLRHQEALAHLLYGVNGGGGFVLLTGEIGAGKTTVCRCFLEQIPQSCDVAYIFNPKLTVAELLSTICVEFGIAYPPDNTSIKVFIDCINQYLLEAHAKGRHTVLVIDEAQNLSAEVLEQMRLLTNLETNERKLLQIILLGQPELADILEKPELRQLAQRIVARYHLGPLTKPEVAAYVQHRLDVSGAQRPLFPASVMGQLFRLSGGVPRVINVLCDRALLGTYVQGKDKINRATLKQAAREVLHQPKHRNRNLLRTLSIGLIFLAISLLGLVAYQQMQREPKTPSVETAIAKTNANVKSKIQTPLSFPEHTLQDTLEWPADTPLSNSKTMAFTTLFKSWGIEYQAGDACQNAETFGLHCYSTRGGLDELRQLNRPAVMQLHDAAGQEFYGILTALDENHASFIIGNQTRAIPLKKLAAQWSGFYTILWKMPANTAVKIHSGDSGPTVEWISKQLSKFRGDMTQTIINPVFDDAMINQIKQFQLSQGLIPDGILGPQTLMRLSGVADHAAPTLLREQGKK